MSENSSIEWTDHTFNTHWGCSKISPGCDHCYAETLAHRFGYGWGDAQPKREFNANHWNELLRWDRRAANEGVRRRVFTNSMSDLFDRFAPNGVRERHWEFVARTPNLDHLLLTKRIGNVARMVPPAWLAPGRWPTNVWIGATVVNQQEADRDIPKILTLPAPVRFLSVEPLLAAIELRAAWLSELSWVIAGGESGRLARPMHPAWIRALRNQCAAAGVPFLFKQWGEWVPIHGKPATAITVTGAREIIRIVSPVTRVESGFYADDVVMRRVGKSAAGRLLDGQLHDGFPRPVPPGQPQRFAR